jgi:hypothetical protein
VLISLPVADSNPSKNVEIVLVLTLCPVAVKKSIAEVDIFVVLIS